MPSVIKLYKHVTPGTYSGLSCIVFVRQFSDQNVTASIFSGDLSLEASSAFANEAILEPLDGSLITSSISTVDRISEHRNVVAGTSGLAIRVTDLACRAIWLGYNQMFQVREHKIINSIAPHSVFAEVQKSGQSEADERWKLIQTRWLSARHVPDVVNWELEENDFVLACSPYISYTSMLHCVETYAPSEVARILTEQAASKNTRMMHGSFVIHLVGCSQT